MAEENKFDDKDLKMVYDIFKKYEGNKTTSIKDFKKKADKIVKASIEMLYDKDKREG